MELLEMDVNMKDNFNVGGISKMSAWPAGIIQPMLDKGMTLTEAMIAVRKEVKPVYVNETHNLITTAGKALICDLLNGTETTGLTYHALGTGTATPVVGGTALTTEVVRRPIDSDEHTALTQVTFSTFYTAAQSGYDTQEAGVFGGVSATSAADSGVMFCHYLQHYDNTAMLVDLTFEYALTIQGY